MATDAILDFYDALDFEIIDFDGYDTLFVELLDDGTYPTTMVICQIHSIPQSYSMYMTIPIHSNGV